MAAASPRAAVTGVEERPAFVSRASLPPAPKQAGAFQRFRYSIDPFEAAEDHKRNELKKDRSKTIGGAFSAGGNARDGKRALKRRMPELRKQLTLALRADWNSFQRIVVDERGVLLALFASDNLSQERKRDLHAYMNRFLTTHPTSAEFALNRDPSRWGAALAASANAPSQPAEVVAGVLVAPASAAPPIAYAFRPPWVPNDLLLAHRLLEQQSLGATSATSHGGGGTPSSQQHQANE